MQSRYDQDILRLKPFKEDLALRHGFSARLLEPFTDGGEDSAYRSVRDADDRCQTTERSDHDIMFSTKVHSTFCGLVHIRVILNLKTNLKYWMLN